MSSSSSKNQADGETLHRPELFTPLHAPAAVFRVCPAFPVVLPPCSLLWRPLHCGPQAKLQWLHLDFTLRYTTGKQAAPSQIKDHLVTLPLLHLPSGPTVHHAHGANVFTNGTLFGCPLRPILSFSSRPFSSFTQVTYCRRSAGNTAGRVSAVQFRVSFRGRHCPVQRRLRLAHARQFENPLPSWTASAPTGWVPLGAHSPPSTHHTPCRADLPRGHCHQCGHACASL